MYDFIGGCSAQQEQPKLALVGRPKYLVSKQKHPFAGQWYSTPKVKLGFVSILLRNKSCETKPVTVRFSVVFV